MDSEYIISWNCNGLKPHLPELLNFLQNTPTIPIIICLQESSLNTSILPNIINYNLLYTTRPNNCLGGGTAIYIKSNIPYTQSFFSKELDSDIEYTSIIIDFFQTNLTITSMYIRPQAHINLEKLSNIKLSKNHLIMGDLNAKHSLWGSPTHDARGNILSNFMEDKNLICVNNGEGTRLGNSGQLSHLDIVLATPNISSKIQFQVLSDNWGSDHYPLKISLFFQPNTIELKNITKWNFKKADWNNFNITFETIIKTSIGPNEHILCLDEYQQEFRDAILNSAKLNIPIQTHCKKHKYSPYWNKQCSEAIAARRTAERKMRKIKNQENTIQYKKHKAIVKITIKRAKAVYWEKYCKTLNKNSNISHIWKTLHRIKGQNQNIDQTCLLKTLKTNDINTLCDNFADHFYSMSADKNLEDDFKTQKNKTITDNLNLITNHTSLNTEKHTDISNINKDFTVQELDIVLFTCNKKSSPGPDEISFLFLVHLQMIGKQYLLKLINQSWSEGKLPEKWKHSFVKPILKHNKNKSEIESYRPISLISNMSKVMEKMINNRLIWYLEKNQLLNKHQFGFRKNYTTTDHLLRMKEEINFSLETGNLTLAIALDFTKAFDLVWRDGLLLKLRTLNISGNIWKWIKDFLTDRENCIAIGSGKSKNYILENGIPQGSSLSPTLFLIMINDFPELSSFTSQALFADDANIWRSGNNIRIIIHHLQEDLNKIENWSAKWGFVLNTEKISGIIFSNRHHNDKLSLKIKNTQIKFENKFKFLGVTFDTKLTWNNQIEGLVSKSQQTMNLMRCFHGQNWGSSSSTLLTIYKSLIRSKLDYGSSLYMDASKTNLRRLDSIQYKALCLVLGAVKGTSLAAILAETGETSLNIRRQTLHLKYLFKIKSNPLNITNEIFYDKPYYNLKQVYKAKNKEQINNFTSEIKVELKIIPYEYNNLFSIPPWTSPASNILLDLILPDGTKLGRDLTDLTFEAAINRNFPSRTHIFVDASKNQSNIIALFIPKLNKAITYAIPFAFGIFATDAFALLKALELIEELNIISPIIFSDNKTLLQQIKNPTYHTHIKYFRPLLTNIIRAKIKQNYTICWIPGHSKLTNHIITDNLTKFNFTHQTYQDIFIELDETSDIINTKYIDIWSEEWRTMRGTKEYINIHKPTNLGRPLHISLHNRQLEIISNRIRLCTNNLNYYQHKIGKSDSSLCDTCSTDETTTHILTNCQKHKELLDKITSATKSTNIETNLKTILSNKTLLIMIATYFQKQKIKL